MARAARPKTAPQEPQSAWHRFRQVIVFALFAVVVVLVAYGAWLALLMHFTKTMPGLRIWQFLGCAVLAAAIYTVCVRIEPLPLRRKRRGKRWLNVETPTLRQIWETAPGDFVESIFTAIGIMATPAMMFIGFGSFVAYEDFGDLMIATAVVVVAFSIEGAFVSWRGRSMFDPPGQVRAPARELPKATAKSDDGLEIGTPDSDAGGAVAD